MRILPDESFSSATVRSLACELEELLGASAAVTVEPVLLLKPAPSGKFRLSRREA